MEKFRYFVVLFFICTLIISGCGKASNVAPQTIRELSSVPSVPSVLPGEQITLTWQAPLDWGPGSDCCYRVEFYNGAEWQYLDTVTETQYTYEVPLDVASAGNRFSVRAETSMGHSDWVVTNPFDILSNEEFLRIEPGDKDLEIEGGEFILVARAPSGSIIAWSADVSWLSVPSESAADEEIKVSVLRNYSGALREGVITACLGELTATIMVTQAGGVNDRRLVVTPRTVNIERPGATSFDLLATIKPVETGRINWSVDVDWLSVPESSKAGVETRVGVKENTTTKSRSGMITATAGDDLSVIITVTQAGQEEPQRPTGVVVPSSLSPGDYTLTWNAPGSWGTGDERQYRVQFYDGNSWNLAGLTKDTQLVFAIPDIFLDEARFRVRAETSHGNSKYVESNVFAIEGGESEPVIEGNLSLINPEFSYEEGNLILVVSLFNEYGKTVNIQAVQIIVKNEQEEVVQGVFNIGALIAPGKTLEHRFEFPLESEPELEGLIAEFIPDYSFAE